ncbi:xylulose kinase-1 [Tanacetum coccineum]
MSGSQDEIPPPPPPPPSSSQTPTHDLENKLPQTMTDAKEMWDAIKSRFGGNDESKKMHKYILKQQFKGFSVSNSEGLHKGNDQEPVDFDKTKVECYNFHKTGHFARECRTKGNQDGRIRDAWNSGNTDGRRSGKREDSKALVTIDGEGVD